MQHVNSCDNTVQLGILHKELETHTHTHTHTHAQSILGFMSVHKHKPI